MNPEERGRRCSQTSLSQPSSPHSPETPLPHLTEQKQPVLRLRPFSLLLAHLTQQVAPPAAVPNPVFSCNLDFIRNLIILKEVTRMVSSWWQARAAAASLIKRKTCIFSEEIGSSCPLWDAGSQTDVPPFCSLCALFTGGKETAALAGTNSIAKILWIPESP